MNTNEAKPPDDNHNWQAIDIFLFSNGQQNSPPRKYHLRTEELNWWDATLNQLAQAQYGLQHSTIYLYTTEGRRVEGPLELIDGMAYVAVVTQESYIDAGYDKYLIKASRSWEKRQAKKSSLETAATQSPEVEGPQLCCVCEQGACGHPQPCCLCLEKDGLITIKSEQSTVIVTEQRSYKGPIENYLPSAVNRSVDFIVGASRALYLITTLSLLRGISISLLLVLLLGLRPTLRKSDEAIIHNACPGRVLETANEGPSLPAEYGHTEDEYINRSKEPVTTSTANGKITPKPTLGDDGPWSNDIAPEVDDFGNKPSEHDNSSKENGRKVNELEPTSGENGLGTERNEPVVSIQNRRSGELGNRSEESQMRMNEIIESLREPASKTNEKGSWVGDYGDKTVASMPRSGDRVPKSEENRTKISANTRITAKSEPWNMLLEWNRENAPRIDQPQKLDGEAKSGESEEERSENRTHTRALGVNTDDQGARPVACEPASIREIDNNNIKSGSFISKKDEYEARRGEYEDQKDGLCPHSAEGRTTEDAGQRDLNRNRNKELEGTKGEEIETPTGCPHSKGSENGCRSALCGNRGAHHGRILNECCRRPSCGLRRSFGEPRRSCCESRRASYVHGSITGDIRRIPAEHEIIQNLPGRVGPALLAEPEKLLGELGRIAGENRKIQGGLGMIATELPKISGEIKDRPGDQSGRLNESTDRRSEPGVRLSLAEPGAALYISETQQHIRKSSISTVKPMVDNKRRLSSGQHPSLKKPTPFPTAKRTDEKKTVKNGKEIPLIKNTGKVPARLSNESATNHAPGKLKIQTKYPNKSCTPSAVPLPLASIHENTTKTSTSLTKIMSNQKALVTDSIALENLIVNKDINALSSKVYKNPECEIMSSKTEVNAKQLLKVFHNTSESNVVNKYNISNISVTVNEEVQTYAEHTHIDELINKQGSEISRVKPITQTNSKEKIPTTPSYLRDNTAIDINEPTKHTDEDINKQELEISSSKHIIQANSKVKISRTPSCLRNNIPATNANELTKHTDEDINKQGFEMSTSKHITQTNSKVKIHRTSCQHQNNAACADANEPVKDKYLAIINKGDVVNLKLNIEVRNGERTINSGNNQNRRSRSLINIAKDEKGSQISIEEEMVVQSKSLQSLLNQEHLRGSGFEGRPKVYIVQCACCGYKNNDPSRAPMTSMSTPNDNKRYVVVLPDALKEDNKKGCDCYPREKPSTPTKIENSCSPINSTSSKTSLVSINKGTGFAYPKHNVGMYVVTTDTTCQTEEPRNDCAVTKRKVSITEDQALNITSDCQGRRSSQTSITRSEHHSITSNSCHKEPVSPKCCLSKDCPATSKSSTSKECPAMSKSNFSKECVVASKLCISKETAAISKRVTSKECSVASKTSFPKESPATPKGSISKEFLVASKFCSSKECPSASKNLTSKECSVMSKCSIPKEYPVLSNSETQTDWCNILLEARRHESGRYSFHLPPLDIIRHYTFRE